MQKWFLIAVVIGMIGVAWMDRICHVYDEKIQPKTPLEQALVEYMHSHKDSSAVIQEASRKPTTTIPTVPDKGEADELTEPSSGESSEDDATPIVTKSSRSSKSYTNLAVFYNVFIPVEKNAKRIMTKIVHEQLQQIVDSTYYRTVYYNLIGSNWTDRRHQFCLPELDCIRLQHLQVGNEVDTLEAIYDFCGSHLDHTVVYLHDKGSFHNEKANRKMRRVATKAALSDPCALSVHENGTKCNVCASRQQVNPHWHAPSNMWSSKCDYIRTLVHPREYEERRLKMFLHLYQNPGLFPCMKEELLQGVIDPADGSYLNASRLQPVALGRFAYETWVYSSPQLVPCHVVDKPLSEFGKGFLDWTPVFLEGPGVGVGEFRGIMKIAWFHKRGRLWEMEYMYNEIPPKDSWFWKAYRVEKVNAEPVC